MRHCLLFKLVRRYSICLKLNYFNLIRLTNVFLHLIGKKNITYQPEVLWRIKGYFCLSTTKMSRTGYPCHSTSNSGGTTTGSSQKWTYGTGLYHCCNTGNIWTTNIRSPIRRHLVKGQFRTYYSASGPSSGSSIFPSQLLSLFSIKIYHALHQITTPEGSILFLNTWEASEVTIKRS